MKIVNRVRRLILVTCVILVGCQHREVAPDIPVDKGALYSHVSFLTALPEPRNFENIPSLDASADYIDSVLSLASDNVSVQTYFVEENQYKNIICTFGPENSDRIVVGAHYDVAGRQPGADDNASGVAGLLEIARLLGEFGTDLPHRIDLVAYSLEEPPFFRTESMGSAVHAKSLYDSSVTVQMMISLEMIGYFDDAPGSQGYPLKIAKLIWPSEANFITVIGNVRHRFSTGELRKLMDAGSDIKVISMNGPSFIRGIDWSDHLNYWKYGYKAVMITDTSFLRNPNYHKETDTIESLDFDKMAEVVKGVYWAIVNL